MNPDTLFGAWLRPGRSLVLLLLVGAGTLWVLGALSPRAALRALEAEVDLEAAYLDRDYARAAERGAARLAMPVAEPSPLLQGVIADAMRQAGRWQEGLRVAERALAFAEDLEGDGSDEAANARNNLAWFLLSLPAPGPAEWDQAYGLAQKAVRRQPHNPYFLGTLATAELRVGRLAEAREHLAASIEAHRDPAARATDSMILAIVLAQLGESAAALRSYHRALSDGRPDERYWQEAKRLLQVDGEVPSDPAPATPAAPVSPPTPPGDQARWGSA